MAGSTALLAVLLAAPVAVATVVAFGLQPFLGVWAYAPAAALVSLLAFVELVPVMGWLGRVFEHTEPTAM
jgi:hypothetical protein